MKAGDIIMHQTSSNLYLVVSTWLSPIDDTVMCSVIICETLRWHIPYNEICLFYTKVGSL